MKKSSFRIPFNLPYMTGKELNNIAEAHLNGILAGDGPFTKRCHGWIESRTGTDKALLTHSCTAALEMAALLIDIQPGDEIIMPSYTFVSTANAFALRGGVPVFVDIREDTLNMDEQLIESAITPRTRAIVPVHYAGVGCEMDAIISIARRHELKVIEDAAQGLMSTYKGRALGSIGDLGAYSFHETKNVISGEGGAILVNDKELCLKAEIVREKGTDRSKFLRGQVDKYTWQEIGSSFLPGEIIAAFLWAQLEEAAAITKKRLLIWNQYHALLEPLEKKGLLKRPHIPSECKHNAHLYYILFDKDINREEIIRKMSELKIFMMSHYVPLHLSNAGKRYGRMAGHLGQTEYVGNSLVRLPLWIGLKSEEQERIVESLSWCLS
uniref:dTDP-4-amino-4,6-dideoxygalactose transaminase n=1 Tax=Polynucleobacter sp. TaxID=2029855 RepID=UPI00404882FB